MTMRAPSDTGISDKTTPPFIEVYHDSFAELLTVLIAQVDAQKSASNSLNNENEEETSRQYLSRISSLIAAHGGGSIIHPSTNAVHAYFRNSKDALNAVIAMYHLVETLNSEKKSQGQLYMKAGIDFGETIRNADDIQGPAVDTAKILKNFAKPGEICTSSQVVNQSKDLPSVHFEVASTWNKKNIPEGLKVYRIVWDATHKIDVTTYPMLYFRPVWRLCDQAFTEAWDDFLRVREGLLGEKLDSEVMPKDKSIIITPKHIESIIPLSLMVGSFLRKRLGGLRGGLIPVQIVADIGPYGKDWKANGENIPGIWEKFNPGYLYISEHAFTLIQQKTEVPGNPIHSFYGEQSFYQVALVNELPPREGKRFLYQKTLTQGNYHPCFYCGDKKHLPVNCPSKNIPETTNALDKLGYLSIDELNNIFYHYVMGGDEGDKTHYDDDLLIEEPYGLAASGFFELKRIFQLRFFRSFWNIAHEEWNKVHKNQNQSEGGLIWIAQDSLRVSELTKAESIIASALDKYPLDYRVYLAAGFLNIDKNNLPRADYYFTQALTIAKTNVQKVYVLLLLSRLCWISGDLGKAYEKIQRALSLNVDSADVIYQDIVFKFFQQKERFACQRLSALIQEDRSYFVTALIDPELAPFSHIIEETLGTILDRARKEADSAITEANNEYELSKVVLGKSALNEIQLLRTQIDQLIGKDSYFGYLDTIDYCNTIISICRKSTMRRKREIWEIFKELNNRLEKNMNFVESFPYKGMVSSYRLQLAQAREKIHYVQNIGPALSQEQLIACQNLKDELNEEWNRLESHLRLLKTFLKYYKGFLQFFRWSGIFVAIVWFLDLFLFPLILYYMNAFLSGFDAATIPNVWFYQKNFLLFGSLIGMSISLIIAIKGLFKH